jgi:hypothetical protein
MRLSADVSDYADEKENSGIITLICAIIATSVDKCFALKSFESSGKQRFLGFAEFLPNLKGSPIVSDVFYRCSAMYCNPAQHDQPRVGCNLRAAR